MSNETKDGWKLETVQDKIETYSRIIKSKLPHISDDELLISVYIFAENNYFGQGDINFKIVSAINFEYSGTFADLLKDLPDLSEAVDVLEAHYNNP